MESISRISSMLETARDLTLEAATSASAVRSTTTSSKPLPPAQIKKLLDSRHEREVLDGLRRVIALQYSRTPQSTSTLTFFPAVLKTLSNPYPSTRPLVYNYLLHHAEADPDTALLAINTIQKSMSDPNARVRAMALKTMSGIRVPVISQIVSLAIKKGVSDLSPLVRKAAALACVKCVRLDESSRPQVEEYITTLLRDKEYYVAGAAVQAFVELCPERLDLIHPVYRRLCRMVVDMDEWGQLAVLKLLTTYARRCFPKRRKRTKKQQTQEQRARDFYDDLEPQAEKESEDEYEEVDITDPDLDLFLTSFKPLLHSRNSAVIIAVTKAYLYLAPPSSAYLSETIGPLIALLRSPQDIQQIALQNVVSVALQHPSLFAPYIRHFLVKASEAPMIWRLKLELLTILFPHSAKEVQDLILAELEHFSHSHDSDLVRESVRAIGRCASAAQPSTSRRCLSLLLKQIHSPDQHLVGEAVEVVRHLIQRNPDEHHKTVIRLAKNLDSLTSPTARASVIWLVGEFAGIDVENNIASDVLRILVKGYVDELSEEVREQIVLLAAKVYLHYLNAKNAATSPAKETADDPGTSMSLDDLGDGEGFHESFASSSKLREEDETHPVPLLWQHTLLLARYTPSYSLRDRARTYRALLSVPSSTELASLLLLAPKPVPQAPSPSEARKDFMLGSASLITGEALRLGADGDGLPDWVKEGEEPDSRLRDEDERVAGASGVSGSGGKAVSAGQMLDEALRADPSYGKGKAGTVAAAGAGRPGAKEKTLDDWLDEESEESGEEEEEESETESGEDEEYETESESDEDRDERIGLVR